MGSLDLELTTESLLKLHEDIRQLTESHEQLTTMVIKMEADTRNERKEHKKSLVTIVDRLSAKK